MIYTIYNIQIYNCLHHCIDIHWYIYQMYTVDMTYTPVLSTTITIKNNWPLPKQHKGYPRLPKCREVGGEPGNSCSKKSRYPGEEWFSRNQEMTFTTRSIETWTIEYNICVYLYPYVRNITTLCSSAAEVGRVYLVVLKTSYPLVICYIAMV